MSEPQAAEQPVDQESTSAGIYTMDDAIDDLVNTPREESIEEEVEDTEDHEVDEETDEDEESESDDQDSEKEQPETEEDEEPDAPDATLPSDDLVIAKDGDIEVTLGELNADYQKVKTEAKELQSTFTKKTQQLAEQVKSVEAQEEKALAHYQAVVNSLGHSLQQLDQTTNWQQLKQTDIAEFQTKLNQRNQLEAQLQSFSQNAEGLLEESKAIRTEREIAQSKAAVTYLTDNINGWNQDLYKKVAQHAESQGIASDEFLSIRSGAVIKAFHDQMRANEARDTALSKVNKKAPKQAKQKAVKRDTRSTKDKKVAKLQERVNKGDRGAAVELLMSQPRE